MTLLRFARRKWWIVPLAFALEAIGWFVVPGLSLLVFGDLLPRLAAALR